MKDLSGGRRLRWRGLFYGYFDLASPRVATLGYTPILRAGPARGFL